MFLWRNKKNISTFQLKKGPYLELCFQGTLWVSKDPKHEVDSRLYICGNVQTDQSLRWMHMQLIGNAVPRPICLETIYTTM